jgi:hypothetical protein
MPLINILPNELINNILLEYITIYDNKGINENIENKRRNIINISINKINKFLCKYIIKRRYEINYYEDSYYIPKKYWKQYYPLRERKYFLKLTNDQKNLRNYDQIHKLYNLYLNNPKNNLTITFNNIIDLLYDDELFNIGW